MNEERIIPITKLHYFYKSLARYSVKRQTEICKELISNPDCLPHLYTNASKDFSRYSNIEEAFVSSYYERKQPKFSKEITKTEHLIERFQKQINLIIKNNSSLSFKYIGREVSPWRTTKTIFETGSSARNSGGGGLDFIGITKNKSPVLGEIKIESDKNAFYAFVQLLTYCSELFTENQIKRIKRINLFGEYNIEPPCNLYIILYNPNPRSATKLLIEKTSELARLFKKKVNFAKKLTEFQKIGCIACLEAIDKNGKISFEVRWEV